ncbi:MAG: hypothetical protein V7638_173, partial [Acidobacteriota bacterium]
MRDGKNINQKPLSSEKGLIS